MPDIAPPRVLIAEDDDVLRKLLAAIASRCGCAVESAADGWEAVEWLKSKPFDVIILDLMMPKMSGYDVIPHVREIQPRPAVLVLTAMSGERYLQLDADVVTAIMHKPFDTDFLQEMLTTLAERMAERRTSPGSGESDGLPLTH
jgi:two-component system response regulator PilR (NtrC family)